MFPYKVVDLCGGSKPPPYKYGIIHFSILGNLSKSGADSGNRRFYAAGALFPRAQRMMQIFATGADAGRERTICT